MFDIQFVSSMMLGDLFLIGTQTIIQEWYVSVKVRFKWYFHRNFTGCYALLLYY